MFDYVVKSFTAYKKSGRLHLFEVKNCLHRSRSEGIYWEGMRLTDELEHPSRLSLL